MVRLCGVVFVVLGICLPGRAQNGDVSGEAQPPLAVTVEIPPSPVLSPEDAVAAFVVEPGMAVSLAGAEPMVVDPVAAAFGADGRLWVVEMRGYMPDADGTGEDQPNGVIAVLTDTTGDGLFDARAEFATGLVLPRAVAPSHGGALVIEPPHLVFLKDTDGDGVADTRTVLADGFGGIASPEHAGNGLLYGLDNWFHLSQHRQEFRFNGTAVEARPIPGSGQWGITQDAVGRLYYTPNSYPLLADLVPPHYAAANEHQRNFTGHAQGVAPDARTWPIRITPGVNRGYRKGTLRDDLTLAKLTGACGPVINTGDGLGSSYEGDAFVCEPCGNLLKRYVMSDQEGGVPRATLAAEGREFLASTDERFRPVNLLIGPDGALYVLDFYRGILQHKIFMTSWLRDQVEKRNLAAPTGLGRIWRIAPEGGEAGPWLDLSMASGEERVAALGDANGSVRMLAQQQLVEAGDTSMASSLRTMATVGESVVSRLHALWTLEGLGVIDVDEILEAGESGEPDLQVAACRLAEAWTDDKAIRSMLIDLAQSSHLHVRVQAALALGTWRSYKATRALAALLNRDIGSSRVRSAIIAGMAGREIDLLEVIADDPAWEDDSPKRRVAMIELADAVLGPAKPVSVSRLLELIASREGPVQWQGEAMMPSVHRAQRLTSGGRVLSIASEPYGWPEMVTAGGQESAAMLAVLIAASDPYLAWPGRPAPAEASVVGEIEGARDLFARGKRLFTVCVTCHQSTGRGLPGFYPPLRDSPFVLGDPHRLALLLIHGLEGPLTVKGKKFDQLMPPAPLATDKDVAAIMTYVRQAWGNDGAAVAIEVVTAARAASADRAAPWTVDELNEAAKSSD